MWQEAAVPVLTFRVGDAHYAAPIDNVVEVVAMVALTAPSQSQNRTLLGYANRHGEILPVVDLRRAFKVESAPPDVDSVFIVLTDSLRQIGAVVDEVLQVEYIDLHSGQPITDGQPFVEQVVRYNEQLIQVISISTLLEALLPASRSETGVTGGH